MATLKSNGRMIDGITGAKTAGTVAVVDDFIAVVVRDIETGDTGAGYLEGSFEFDSDDTLAAGAKAYWNAGSSKITDDSTDVYAGRVVVEAASSKVTVRINFGDQSEGS